MKIARGQVVAGKLHEPGPMEVFAVKGHSELKNGDRKVWLLRWTPGVGNDTDTGLDAEVTMKFPGGELTGGWKVLDFWDPNAMLARVEKAIMLHKLGSTDEQLALKCLQAMFAGPTKE